jgi:signal transduction histidine kinase
LSGSYDEPEFASGTFGDDLRIRLVSLRYYPDYDEEHYEEQGIDPDEIPEQDSIGVELVLARETTSLDAMLFRLRALIALVTLIAGSAAAVVLGYVIRGSLRPLERLAGRIAQLDDGNLSRRVDLERPPQEIHAVVNQLNSLLERLEVAFERERTFSADIAHEFRTPLAGLRSTMEVAISQPRDGAEYEETLHESLQIVQRLQFLVERLLYLCRLDAGRVETEETLVDLGELVQTAWSPLAETAAERKLDVRWALPEGVTVATDPMLLEVAMRNLLENAVAHANESGYVSVEITDAGDSAHLFIANSGSTVSQDRVPELLARFTRADESRNETGRHVGLGLALVNRIATILRASLDVAAQSGGEFRVTLTLGKRAG